MNADTIKTKLAALGYENTPASVRKFQGDYNRTRPTRLLAVTGELDADTLDALDLAHDSAQAFMLVRAMREGR